MYTKLIFITEKCTFYKQQEGNHLIECITVMRLAIKHEGFKNLLEG